jgi:aspartyl protease family protein
MITGFIDRVQECAARSLAALLLVLPLAAHGTDISVMGLFNGKAVLVIDGGKPRTVNVGQTTPEGIKLLSASSESAVVEYGGQRQTLGMGHATRIGATRDAGFGQATLTADSRGQFVTTGTINGTSVRFLVDTGASSVALSVNEARRLGINYLSGSSGQVSTANGTAMAYKLKLDNVRVGEITLNNVDCVVVDGLGLNIALLGMSFLNRTQMKRDGDTLTLVRRY